MAAIAVIARIAIIAIVPAATADSRGPLSVLSVRTSLRWPGLLTTTCFCTVSSLEPINFSFLISTDYERPALDDRASCNPRVCSYRVLRETSAAKNGVIDDQEHYGANHCHE